MRRVRAFLVPRHPESPAEPSLAELKDFVRARLERFKAPKEVAFLPEIPRNATGKVLRTQLRDLPDSALRFAKGGGHESAED
jgi:fatty-acyl-CoA synthase